MVRIIPENFLKLARSLRKHQTPWETKLWYYLRGNRFGGLKFKRQYKIGDYIADFYCTEKKLIIEIDGGQHNEDDKSASDKKRTQFLEKEGFAVLRFWNNDIDHNIEGVLEQIRREL